MDALIVIFLSGLFALFAAFSKKPALVLFIALLGLGLSIGLFACEMSIGHSFINLGYDGLQFDSFALKFSTVLSVFTLLIIALGYTRFKENVEHTGEYIGLLMFL